MSTMRHHPAVRDDLDLHKGDFNMQLISRGNNDREEKFRKRFVEVPKEEELIDYYSCALSRDYYLQHGAIYITTNLICFRSNIFGQERKLIIPTADVQQVLKVNTFRLIPSGILIVTAAHKYQFESFRNRQAAYTVLKRITNKGQHPLSSRTDPLTPASPLLEVRRPSRFIKSQSSCSLERTGLDEDTPSLTSGSHENLLRPLINRHDYLRKNSRVGTAVSSSENNIYALVSRQAAEDEEVVEKKEERREQACQTDTREAEERRREERPVICIQISARALIILGYLICILLTFSALVHIKELLIPSTSAASLPRHLTTVQKPAKLHAVNHTFHLLHSILDTSSTILLQTQQIL